ncbi:MAG: 23S rRNA (uracil-C(5))-methyltransferase RlmCD [Chlamydiae bacterium]|nr:23S rRNA (uracil-C(5))-methyltransferase RlmCD [Chlamydiota bacterium]
MKSKPRVNQEISLTIQRLGVHGEGVGYWHGYTVFVDGALPGEVIQARLIQCKKNYGRGVLVNIESPSTLRVSPPCPFFGRCGGCQLMHLDYGAQLEVKRQRVVDALERIGKFVDCKVKECLPSPSAYSYRNKIQVPVRPGPEGIRLGFFARNSNDLVEVERCTIHCDLGEKVYKDLSLIVKKSDVSAYDWNAREGDLRFVIIKTAVNTSQVLVIFVTHSSESEKFKVIAQDLMKRCPEVKGVIQNINTIPHNVVLGEKFHLLEGVDHIEEKILGMTFTVSAPSFFQVNPAQAERLYAKVIEFAELTGEEKVVDAYCGVGVLTLLLSQHAKQVVGIECVSQAIEDANVNARLNEVSNVTFICDDAESWIKNAEESDVIILNPPRKGCEPSLLKEVGRLLPKRIIYVSCDPATLARDLALLREYEYGLDVVHPVDMFPQTAHVETVVKLSRNSGK